MMADAAGPDLVPRMLGRYHVLEALGDSPLGVLHLARLEGPQHFQRWAVVLRLHPELCERGALVDAFYDAARITARLQHPNVAAAYDVGEPGEPPWAAYEYVHGESAEELLVRSAATGATVPWDIACRIVSDAAAGIEAIHELLRSNPGARSLLQGPLAPSSIVIGYDGKTKIVDGCLRAFDPSALPYTAPEAVGALADERTDVFALGVLLWELVAGRRLFAGASEEETRGLLAAHHVPPLKSLVRCPTKIDEIVSCALASDAGARYQTARALARGLQAVVVAKGLVLTDDLVARYLYGVFRDRFDERQALLTAAANVTEVFRREDIEHLLAPDTVRQLPGNAGVMEIGTPPTRRGGFEAPTRRGLDLVNLDDPTVPRKREKAVQELPTVPIHDPDGLSSTGELPTKPLDVSNRAGAPLPVGAAPLPPPRVPPEPPTVPRLPPSGQEAPQSPHAGTPAPTAAPLAEDSRLAIGLLCVALLASAVLVFRLIQVKRTGVTAPSLASAATAVAPGPSGAASPPPTGTAVAASPPTATAPVPTPSSDSTSTPASDSTSTAPSAPTSTAAAAPRPHGQTRRSSRGASRTQADDSSSETGLLTVVCSPACDDVVDGSHSLGPSPVFKAPVAAGPHTLTLRTTDPPVEKTVAVVVSADDTTVVRQSMAP